MTMREADEAACKFLPVMCNGIEYRRITQTGYNYDLRNGRSGFVQLLDMNSNSVTYAKPEHCTLKFEIKNTEKEQEHEQNDQRDPTTKL